MQSESVPPGTVFVSHEELKQTVGVKKVLKVFLVDSEGKRHLAATGEDLGDAHYHYRSSKPFSKFGVVDGHNRKDLMMWLERIIAETSNKEGQHLEADEDNPQGVYFTAHKYERAHMADSRRVNRWYLVDQHGNAHLAVIGVERDTKDGHYTYGAEEPFSSLIPLQCSNQTGVFRWLEKWITHHAPAATPPQGAGQAAASGAQSGVSADGQRAPDAANRKPPLFISLSAIRQARKSAAALLAADATIVDPNIRAKPRPKQAAAAAGSGAAASSFGGHGGVMLPDVPKPRPIGIVQQNQIKKARKLQEETKAEEERLVSGHLLKLRRAAAAELRGDNEAKQVTMSWLQGSLTEDELEAAQHWVSLLRAVLDLQQQHQHWQEKQQQQQQQQKRPRKQQAGAGDETANAAHASLDSISDKGNSRQQPQGTAACSADPQPEGSAPGDQRQQQVTDGSIAAPLSGLADGELLSWLQQPGNERHHLRITLECLKELAAVDLPAHVLLTHKVIELVTRCLAEAVDESVKSLASHTLQRWKWQLCGHMQVLTNPVYMEDHLAVLEEEVAAGAVPLPRLPKHKQMLITTQLPSIAGTTSGRMQYPTAHTNSPYQHPHQHQLPLTATGFQAMHVQHGAAAAGTGQASGCALTGHVPGYSGTGFEPSEGLGLQVNPAALNPAQMAPAGFNAQLSALPGLHGTGSSALVPTLRGQHPLLQQGTNSSSSQALMMAQPMGMFSNAQGAVPIGDAYGPPGTLTWPFTSAALPAAPAGQQVPSSTMLTALHHQQQQPQGLLLQQLQQGYLHQPAHALQQPSEVPTALAAQPAPGHSNVQLLAPSQAYADPTAQQQLLQWQQQQQWLSMLQQPSVLQPDQSQQQNLQQQVLRHAGGGGMQ